MHEERQRQRLADVLGVWPASRVRANSACCWLLFARHHSADAASGRECMHSHLPLRLPRGLQKLCVPQKGWDFRCSPSAPAPRSTRPKVPVPRGPSPSFLESTFQLPHPSVVRGLCRRKAAIQKSTPVIVVQDELVRTPTRPSWSTVRTGVRWHAKPTDDISLQLISHVLSR